MRIVERIDCSLNFKSVGCNKFFYLEKRVGVWQRKKRSEVKTRDWIAVAAWFRTSAGGMKNKKKYTRKQKHKGKGDN